MVAEGDAGRPVAVGQGCAAVGLWDRRCHSQLQRGWAKQAQPTAESEQGPEATQVTLDEWEHQPVTDHDLGARVEFAEAQECASAVDASVALDAAVGELGELAAALDVPPRTIHR